MMTAMMTKKKLQSVRCLLLCFFVVLIAFSIIIHHHITAATAVEEDHQPSDDVIAIHKHDDNYYWRMMSSMFSPFLFIGGSNPKEKVSFHHRHLQQDEDDDSGGFLSSLFRRRFCVPDGSDSLKTETVFLFRARRFRRRYGAELEGSCNREKCSSYCTIAAVTPVGPCRESFIYSSNSHSCICVAEDMVGGIPVECGINAECVESVNTCVCHDGFQGDPFVECNSIPTDPPLTTTTPTASPTTSSPSTFPPTTMTSSLQCPEPCQDGNKCCAGVCIQNNQCCIETGDGKQCNNGSCANSIGNFGCCPENIACGADTCCDEGLKCCSGTCKPANCCDNPDPCCGKDDDPCCGSNDPCCGSGSDSDTSTSNCLPTGTGYGEPHLTTFDGLAYDCQAQGEFILTKSLNSALEIQARFQRIPGLSASITKGLAIRTSTGTTVQVVVSEQQHSDNDSSSRLFLWIDGVQVMSHQVAQVYKSDTIEFGKQDGSSNYYYIFCPDASIYITVLDSPQGQFMDFKINLMGKYRNEELVGLLGTPDDDPTNDWMDGDTTAGIVPIPIPNTRQDLTSVQSNEYCTRNWCIREEIQSLFLHDDSSINADFDTYRNGCDETYPGRPSINDPVLQDYCGTDLDCLLDGYLFGIETARSSVAAQTRYLESSSNAKKRFRVSPINLVQGVDTKINVTLDLRNNNNNHDFDWNIDNIDSFGLYVIDESTGTRLPNRIATLKRLSISSRTRRDMMESDLIFIGEDIDISGLPSFQSGDFAGLQACPADSETVTTDCRRTVTARKAFRALNKFGEGKCFETKGELKLAVKEYLLDSSRDSAVARKYGWPIGIWCVKYIQDFSGLFANAITFDESLNSWDLSQATSLASMFEGASVFNSDISTWNVENIKDMSAMFSRATSFNTDISAWNVTNVETTERMFYAATNFNIDISQWELKSIINLQDMFGLASAYDKNLCGWTQWLIGQGAVDTRDMFFQATSCPMNRLDAPTEVDSLIDLCHICGSAPSPAPVVTTARPTIAQTPNSFPPIVTTARPTIAPTSSSSPRPTPFKQITSSPSSSSGPSTFKRISSNAELRQALDGYFYGDADNVTSYYGWWVGDWDVGLVTDFSWVFKQVSGFSQNLNKWDVSRATTMAGMFAYSFEVSVNISDWNVSRVTDMSEMFYSASSFTGLGSYDQIDCTTQFNCPGPNLENWDVSKLVNMSGMFHAADLELSFDLSKWKVSSVVDMSYAFASNQDLNQSLAAWDVSSAEDMTAMFFEASRFSHNLCPWGKKLQNDTVVSDMFRGSFCFQKEDPNLSISTPGPLCHSCDLA